MMAMSTGWSAKTVEFSKSRRTQLSPPLEREEPHHGGAALAFNSVGNVPAVRKV